MKKVLITGASGFIGYHLVKVAAQNGRSVRCMVRKTSNVSKINSLPVEITYGQIGNTESIDQALQGVSTVFHLAGITKEARPGQFFQINTEGTRELVLSCARQPKPPLLIYVSSLAAAGPAVDDVPKTETDPSSPVSKYGQSKLAAERFLIECSGQVPCTIVRPPIVFGEEDFASLELFRIVRNTRLHLVPGCKNQPYSFIHATDLAEFLLLAENQGERLTENSEKTGRGIYYTSCGENVTFSDFGRMIGSALKLNQTCVIHCPSFSVYAVGLVNEVLKRSIGRSAPLDWNKAIESLHGPWICSAQKGMNQFDFKPEKSLQHRIDQTALWYQENNYL